MITQRRVWIILTTFFLSIAAIALSWVYFLYSPVVKYESGFQYNVKVGAGFKSITSDLYQQNIIRHPLYFSLLIRLTGSEHKIKAGEYIFPKGSTPLNILNQIVSGEGVTFRSFAIIPGSTFKEIRADLNASDLVSHTSRNLSDDDLMKRISGTTANPEGLFFPETYYFVKDSSDVSLLKRAYQMMQTNLNKAWQTRANDLPYKTAYEALIAASLIEKETGLNAERPLVASVLVNRLNKGILLQFDPTVIYGIGARYTGKITREDLLDNNPYNTYINKGLPPTPIAMPSASSITAVLHPAMTNYIFFVAKGFTEGHQFSETLDAHNKAVMSSRKYHPVFVNKELIRRYLDQQVIVKP